LERHDENHKFKVIQIIDEYKNNNIKRSSKEKTEKQLTTELVLFPDPS
jgi:hypothetical protein